MMKAIFRISFKIAVIVLALTNLYYITNTEFSEREIIVYEITEVIGLEEAQVREIILNEIKKLNLSQYNQTKLILDNNESWLSTYNKTYENHINKEKIKEKPVPVTLPRLNPFLEYKI